MTIKITQLKVSNNIHLQTQQRYSFLPTPARSHNIDVAPSHLFASRQFYSDSATCDCTRAITPPGDTGGKIVARSEAFGKHIDLVYQKTSANGYTIIVFIWFVIRRLRHPCVVQGF